MHNTPEIYYCHLYKKEIVKKIDDKSYWILYNNNPDEDYYIVSQVN